MFRIGDRVRLRSDSRYEHLGYVVYSTGEEVHVEWDEEQFGRGTFWPHEIESAEQANDILKDLCLK